MNESGNYEDVNDCDVSLPTYLDHPSTKCDEL